jgi:hypothetical protein
MPRLLVPQELRGLVVIPDDIRHLDSDESSPFDALVAVDSAIAVARVAYTNLLARLLYDAVRDDQEGLFADAMSHLWAARECMKGCADA